MKVYLAGPFFNREQVTYIEQAESILRQRGFEVFSPREHEIPDGENMPNYIWGQKVFQMDVDAMVDCDCVVAIYHGMYSDTGTAWEVGYAFSQEIPVVLVCTDKRIDQSVMMINASRAVLVDVQELQEYDFARMDAGHVVNTQK